MRIKGHENEFKRVCNLTDKERTHEYIESAKSSWERLNEILKDPEGWRTDKGDDWCTGLVHSKHYVGEGRCFKMEAYVDCTPEQLFQFLVTDVEKIPEWNHSISHSKVLQSPTDHLNVHYTRTKDMAGGLISKRDFVNLQYWKPNSDHLLLACMAAQHPHRPAIKHVVRAENRSSGFAIYPVDGDAKRCLLIWIHNTDLKGWLPKWGIDQVMATELLKFLQTIRDNIHKAVT